MRKGRIKHLFPGGNTSVGFFSYYDHMIAPDATRIFVIKGGPGVGKSTFMRAIGEEMRARGFDVEHHHCSSDNSSLDGLVIPAIGVALLDGTAPHVVDPQIPGAVSEIIHLGDYWDETRLRADKARIANAHRTLSRRFAIAYNHLAEAKVIRDEMESYVTEAMNFVKVNRLTAELIAEIIGQTPGQYQTAPKSRHLFCSAISPAGVVHDIGSLLRGITQLHLLRGRPGSGRSTLVEKVTRAAEAKGLDTEVFHCAFEPHRVDLVIIPAARTAVLKEVEEIDFQPAAVPGLRVLAYNLDVHLDQKALALYRAELAAARDRFAAALSRAISQIAKAKQAHDHLESFYIPAMDFAAVARKRKEILERILNYAAEQGKSIEPVISETPG